MPLPNFKIIEHIVIFIVFWACGRWWEVTGVSAQPGKLLETCRFPEFFAEVGVDEGSDPDPKIIEIMMTSIIFWGCGR